MVNSDIVIYTDGGCSGNPGPGGWGIVVEADGQTQCFCFATPILMDEEEMAKVTEAFLRGIIFQRRIWKPGILHCIIMQQESFSTNPKL